MSKLSLTRFVREPRRHNKILFNKTKLTLVLIHDVKFDLSIPHFIDISDANRQYNTLHLPYITPAVANNSDVQLP